LVVVASPRPIGREWRLIVVEDRIVASSQYAEGRARAITTGSPHEVRSFTAAMLADVRWRPDPIFMVDVCESGDQLWLVELNSFSSSWLYQCDLSTVVREASALAIRTWTRSAVAEP
jgi:hypothetical protein